MQVWGAVSRGGSKQVAQTVSWKAAGPGGQRYLLGRLLVFGKKKSAKKKKTAKIKKYALYCGS